MVRLIEQTAVEVAQQEDRLRRLLIELVKQGRSEDAVAMLNDWGDMPPGEVLEKHCDKYDGCTG